MKTPRCLLVLAALLGGSAHATILWRGDFETGDRSQYYSTQMVSADRLAIVSSPARQGRYALKATVKQGDDPISSSGNRNELVYKAYEKVGSEYWYRWSTMFAPDYPIASSWALFIQWHQDSDCCGSPPVSFYTNGNEIRLQAGGGSEHVVWTAPLARGVWHEFIFHVKWSPDPKVGFVELYYDGEHVLPKTYKATQQAGDLNYLKIGLYRDESISATGVVFHDDVVQATTLEDLKPQQAQQPASPSVDAGTPSAPSEEVASPSPTTSPVGLGAPATAGGAFQSGAAGGVGTSEDGASEDEPTQTHARSIGCSAVPLASSLWGVALFALWTSRRRRGR